MRVRGIAIAALLYASQALAQPAAVVQIDVRFNDAPVGGVTVVVNGVTFTTPPSGSVSANVIVGTVEITAVKDGFATTTTTIAVQPGQTQRLVIDLQQQVTVEEHVTVSATRTDRRLEDQPMRVETLNAEEIEEKQLMTPGDIVMMLNEMGGLRVQATSPSLGAASVRVQGMRGRYTRFLSDGLPLFGADVGGLGLLQIPPTDLGQVEVIKGVASALYGAGALGGVVDLISKRPAKDASRDALVNRTSRGGTDAVLFASQPLTDGWSGTLLVGGHWQEQNDVDGDGWADLAGYSRGVIRPRLFWNGDRGRSIFATGGVMVEDRNGGTVQEGVLPATGAPYLESLDTVRVDGGLVAQTPLGRNKVLTARVSVTHKDGIHQLGEVHEHDLQNTVFSEVALRGVGPRQTWVGGVAYERSTLDPRERPDLQFAYNVPGLFGQDDIDLQRWLTLSISARVDRHSEFGTFASPRVSALMRARGWTSRLSLGSGFFGSTPLTEETEAAGLTRLRVPQPLRAERGRSASFDVTRGLGPVTVTGTLFRYHVDDPAIVERDTYALTNLPEATITQGFEGVATLRHSAFNATATYTYVHSQEGVGSERGEIPLTPRHSAGLVGMWERDDWGRIGLEAYFTGRQRLEDNPYRSESAAYVLFGALIERRFGRVRLFLNAEDLGNVRQSHWDPLIRPSRAIDGRWTVDAWAPLDGR
ncbi:MAG TPA: TonB-dependent receptor, partial [Vicinamibacterales bacterium]|nr:TonB-dependent receptor [Vicinamibacterales bacterium]